MVESYKDLNSLCYLENKFDSKSIIKPHKVITPTDDALSLYFSFKNVTVPGSEPCYKLKCTTAKTTGKELIRDL